MPRFLLGLCLSLFCASVLQAQLEVGALAPEIPKSKWINTKKPMSLEALPGRVVVLIFWDAEEPESLLDGTPFFDLWKPLHEKGAVFLALTENSAEVIAPIAESKKLPVAIATSCTASQLYLPGEESMAFIIGWDGRIVWRGSPRSKDMEGVLEKQIKLAHDLGKTWDPRPMHDEVWDKFVEACLDDDLKKAEKALDKIVDGKNEDLAMHAVGMYFVMHMHPSARMKYAKRIALLGRAHEAVLLLEESAKLYKGYDTANDLKDEAKTIKKDFKSFLSMDKKRIKALEKAFAGDRDGALKALEALLPKAKESVMKALLQKEIGYLKTMGVLVGEE